MHNLTKIRLFRILLCITYPISLVFILPFALIKKKHNGRLFFFFDRFSIGGAQRVHLDILNSVADRPKQLYFTRVSPNDKLKDQFYNVPNTIGRDIHFWCDNLLFRLFTVHYYAFYINRHRNAHIFSANSTFFFDMLFFLRKTVVTTELLHAFSYGKNGMELFGLANCKYLTHRMIVDEATWENLKKQYDQYRIPTAYSDCIHLIEPGVYVPEKLEKIYTLPLKILYAGRGGVPKRIYLLNSIAEKCIENNLPVQFHFAGTLMDELSDLVKNHSVLYGEISEHKQLFDIYEECHAVIMTSAYEGFPMLIKEGMAFGCIPVITHLEGTRGHLRHMENVLYMFDHADEGKVIKQGYDNILFLTGHLQSVEKLSANAYQHALIHFNKDNFTTAYHKFLTEN